MDENNPVETTILNEVLFYIRKTKHGVILFPHFLPREGESMIMDMLDVLHGIPNDYYIAYNAQTQTLKFERT